VTSSSPTSAPSITTRGIDQKLAALRGLDPTQPAALDRLRDALRANVGILVARAAALVAEHRVTALVDELVPAFDRLRVEGAKRDPGCRGKIAIAKALHDLEHWEPAVFEAGLACTQLEGWGDNRDDTAAALRGMCGVAHAHFARPDALDVLAALLADKEVSARIGAAQGLGDAGRPDATALLRYKLLASREVAEVTSACLDALFALDAEGALPFAVKLLAAHDERAELAAIALGTSRLADAVAPLIAWTDAAAPDARHQAGYLALALLRRDAATAHLLDAVRAGGPEDAVAAAKALATFKDDPHVVERTRDAARDQPAKVRAKIDALLQHDER
jgi:hypothetical protein